MLVDALREMRGAEAAHGLHLPEQIIDQTPSLPDARPRSDRFRCGGRESNFLAVVRPKTGGYNPGFDLWSTGGVVSQASGAALDADRKRFVKNG